MTVRTALLDQHFSFAGHYNLLGPKARQLAADTTFGEHLGGELAALNFVTPSCSVTFPTI